MTIFHGLDAIETIPKNLAITIGNFDGVHRGHQALLTQLHAQARGANSLVITFEPHPGTIADPAFRPLMTLPTKVAELARRGVTNIWLLPLGPELFRQSPANFWQLLTKLEPVQIVVGADFHFGHQRAGTVSELVTWGKRDSLSVTVVPEFADPFKPQFWPIHSQTIRELLSTDHVAEALDLLGHPYRLVGRVQAGFGRGRDLGFPTANLGDIPTIIPADGIYAAQTTLADRTYLVALSIGTAPVFGDNPRQVEAHIIDYSGNLYDQELDVSLTHYLRPQIKFATVPELVSQIQKDITRIQARAKEE